MTAREARAMLDQVGILDLGGLRVEVLIVDVREVYGRVDFLVTPIAGSGQVWKAERSISYGELAELQDLAEHIDPGDAELLEAAGIPEQPEQVGKDGGE